MTGLDEMLEEEGIDIGGEEEDDEGDEDESADEDEEADREVSESD